MEPSIVGRWGYRCLINDRDLLTPFANLRAAVGTLQLEIPQPGVITGVMETTDGNADRNANGDADGPLALSGTCTLEGKLIAEATRPALPESWSFLAWLVPRWPQGTQQIDALVGSMVHPGAAQLVTSFIAVRDPISHANGPR